MHSVDIERTRRAQPSPPRLRRTPEGLGTEEILYADLDLDAVERSHARRLFLRDRRPELYPDWLGPRHSR